MRASRLIDTGAFAAEMRAKVVRPKRREILVSRLAGSSQEIDLSAPTNCEGLGRVRHFRRSDGNGWPDNPLPLDPAARALGLPRADLMTAQVFQNAACAWRCWFCYVPFPLLRGDAARGRWTSAERLVELYAQQANPPAVIDLSGGSPDLTPEWIVWTMEALRAARLSDRTYLWSDDNLSTDYVFSVLSNAERDTLAGYANYGRVCCFKGFDEPSFCFNTGAAADGFDRQFALFSRYVEFGLDLYGYAILTGPDTAAVTRGVPAFLDRLQRVHPALPLRVVPLRIQDFTPNRERQGRLADPRVAVAREVQEAAKDIWLTELERRFTPAERALSVTSVRLR